MFWKLTWGNPNVVLGLAPAPPQPTRRATADDFEHKPMTQRDFSSYEDLYIELSQKEMQQVLMGHLPDCQEDHWFMYCTDNTIRIFRSWTGMCAFEAHYIAQNDKYIIDQLTINRALWEFGVNSDEAAVCLFTYILRAILNDNPQSAWQKYLNTWAETYHKSIKYGIV